jgi:hypothetical protein
MTRDGKMIGRQREQQQKERKKIFLNDKMKGKQWGTVVK